ncbi:hypothetical protein Pedsa_2801 [Pseudopedobacter saltans DSM 12145]|uniref:Glycosyltransferase 61 catalytic domain-containing protein n=1 Tax=Pseudopedobacter saltans (strain ATCC 51119 / DSM 12145 / JCM 21818 / CCUG 39354 / LMG 10337 / NBRC 100064 / NCIMB 13643) TaxID=762903 RepID=F0S7T7_PSESL|nr:glycosyltransferase family 61 protein [Pseudopedobacter saltans]ADY53342.1 hypothetical protein Pedsa_2801 [Pseudopedobacter saltans DSM 12145]
MKDKKFIDVPPNPLMNYSGAIKRYFMAKMRRMYRRDKFELLKPLVKAITSNWFIKRELIDFQSYRKRGSDNVEILYEDEINLKFSSVNFFEESVDNYIYELKNHYVYGVILKNVMVIGCSDLILLDEQYALYDLKFLDDDGAFDYTDYAIKLLKNDVCVLEANWAEFSINEGILLTANYSINYYHFLLEIIAKFEMISKMNIDKSIPIIVDKACLEIPQYRELLSYFNRDNRAIISIDKEVIYKVSFLYQISRPNIIPPNYKNIKDIQIKHNLFSAHSLNYIRGTLLKLPEIKNTPKRVFLSRKNASGRRVYNEEAVYTVLRKYDFSIIYPEEYSIVEQVSIFKNAELIVGATGAAFTNLIFCSNSCKVICLTNFNVNISIFCTIAKLFNIELVYLYDKKLVLKGDSDLHSAFQIDTNKLKEALQYIIGSK